jgi:phage terminase small subunit
MAGTLTAKQEAFCLAFVETGNASEAYRSVYDAENCKPETIWVKASELLNSGKVSVRIKELRDAIAERVEIDRAWVLDRLVANAEKAATAEPVLNAEGEEIGEYKYQGQVVNRALELIGKEIGMFIDRKEVGKPGDFADLSDDELDAAIEQTARDLGISKEAAIALTTEREEGEATH